MVFVKSVCIYENTVGFIMFSVNKVKLVQAVITFSRIFYVEICITKSDTNHQLLFDECRHLMFWLNDWCLINFVNVYFGYVT